MPTSKTKSVFIHSKNTSILEVDSIELTQAQKAASLCFRRKDRFVENYFHEKELFSLINMFFGNVSILNKNGLTIQFNKLKEYVVKYNLVGLILTGVNNKTLVNMYTTINNNTISLTISSITRTLLQNHFSENEINELCISTPNFNIYYKEDDEIN